MDLIDKKIMKELDINPKLPLSTLAKKLRISQQVADYRLKRLLKNEIILKFTPIINLKSLGQEHYRVFFTFNPSKYSNEEIFNYLRNREGIYWAARIGGKYDLTITLWLSDFASFDMFIHNLNAKFPKLIKGYKASYVVDHRIYGHKHLSKNYSEIRYGYEDKKKDIDELDYFILQNIKDNCRISALQLAEKRGVSYKTIINRIKSMEQKKIILGYRMYLKSVEDIKQSSFIVLFSFKNYLEKCRKDLFAHFNRLDIVTQSLRLFGMWDVFLHIRAEGNEQVQEAVINLREKFDIIDDYEIIPVFEDIAINLLPVKGK